MVPVRTLIFSSLLEVILLKSENINGNNTGQTRRSVELWEVMVGRCHVSFPALSSHGVRSSRRKTVCRTKSNIFRVSKSRNILDIVRNRTFMANEDQGTHCYSSGSSAECRLLKAKWRVMVVQAGNNFAVHIFHRNIIRAGATVLHC